MKTERSIPSETTVMVSIAKLICSLYISFARSLRFTEAAEREEKFDTKQCLRALGTNEDEAILTHAMRLVRWLRVAHEQQYLTNHVGSEFDALSPIIKEVRDMREHGEEYLQNVGRDQNNFVRTFLVDEYSFPINAHWSFSYEGKRYLGGRLSLEQLASALSNLRDELLHLEKWDLPWHPIDLIRIDDCLRASVQTSPDDRS